MPDVSLIDGHIDEPKKTSVQKAYEWFKEELEGGKCSDHCEQCNANEIALRAIEKQIPKKVKDREKYGAIYFVGYCPSCNEGANDEMRYCDGCGQALDWSDTDCQNN